MVTVDNKNAYLSEIDNYFYGNGIISDNDTTIKPDNSIAFSIKFSYIVRQYKFLNKSNENKFRIVCKLCKPGTNHFYTYIREHIDELIDFTIHNDHSYLEYLKHIRDNGVVDSVVSEISPLESYVGRDLIDEYIKLNGSYTERMLKT